MIKNNSHNFFISFLAVQNIKYPRFLHAWELWKLTTPNRIRKFLYFGWVTDVSITSTRCFNALFEYRETLFGQIKTLYFVLKWTNLWINIMEKEGKRGLTLQLLKGVRKVAASVKLCIRTIYIWKYILTNLAFACSNLYINLFNYNLVVLEIWAHRRWNRFSAWLFTINHRWVESSTFFFPSIKVFRPFLLVARLDRYQKTMCSTSCVIWTASATNCTSTIMAFRLQRFMLKQC